MKCNPNQSNTLRRQAKRAFTLIEMIGVLAVIAILAALLIPRVFSAINDARVNSACVNIETVKTALADHYGKYGKFDQLYGTNTSIPGSPITGIVDRYDQVILMAEGLLDKPFASKIAGGDPVADSTIEICAGGQENGTVNGYYLSGTNNQTAGAQYVIEAKLSNVSAQDAKDLNDRIDGISMGAVDLVTQDNKGRVEYAAPVGGLVSALYIYITHR